MKNIMFNNRKGTVDYCRGFVATSPRGLREHLRKLY